MNTQEHVIDIPLLQEDSSVQECLNAMLDVECFELPVIKDGKVYGKIILEDLLDQEGTIANSIEQGFPCVALHTHLFDVMRVMRETNASVCAVLDGSGDFVGIITKQIVLNRLSHAISVEQVGAIVVVEMASHQYSSSEIARIVEGENAQILGMWMQQIESSGRVRISIKLNTVNAERIVNGFMRFNYEVIATFGDQDYREKVEKRYQSLMKYLDI